MAKPTAGRGFDHVRAARALADAHDMGEEEAAKFHGVTSRSLRNWRALLETHEALRKEYTRLKLNREAAWDVERVHALRVALSRACELLKSEADLDKVTRFLDRVGGVDVAGKVLSAVGSGAHQQGSPPPGSEDGAGEAGEGAVEVH